jgi:hypothetical protein
MIYELKNGNGKVEMNDIVTRKMRKDMTAKLYGGDVRSENVSIANVDEALEGILLQVITKITINGVDMPVTTTTLDDMDNLDVKALQDNVNKMMGIDTSPNK